MLATASYINFSDFAMATIRVRGVEPPTCHCAQRTSWRHHKTATKPTVPLRCPSSLLKLTLPRLPDLVSARAQRCLREGEAFVAPTAQLLGKMLDWDLDHLQRRLPADIKWGVHMVREKLVMSHSVRYGGAQQPTGPPADERFEKSATRVFTFSEFVELATKRDSNPSSEGRPYLGIDVFKRSGKQDVAGHHGSIGQALLSEFTSAPLHATLTSLHSSGKLPLLSSIHLFIGMARINYHCHYDLNPNLHFQLVGRKRFILFPPEEWRHLYPFPVHHDLDRRSQLNLDNPTIEEDQYPKWQEAQRHVY